MSDIDVLLSEINIFSSPTRAFFGMIKYNPGGTYGPRVQRNYQIVAVHKGHVWIDIDHQPHFLNEGEVALFKPGHHEFFEFAKDRETQHSWCDLHWNLDSETAKIIRSFPFKSAISETMNQLLKLGASVQSNLNALTPLTTHLAVATFWEYVNLITQFISSEDFIPLPKPLQRVQTFVLTHYPNELNLDLLSQVAHMTPEHLIRLFREHLHVTPMRFVWQVRTQQGAQLLRYTGLSVEEVARNCGFKTLAHFSRTVKAHFGHSPLEIRTLHWQTSKIANLQDKD
jgi:AraC family transcriptional regulator of arabinose operon